MANQTDKANEGRAEGGRNSGGNFKNDPERAAEAGSKGGKVSVGNFMNDPQRALGHAGSQYEDDCKICAMGQNIDHLRYQQMP